MKAETAYNVIQALSQDELVKLYKLLGVKHPDALKIKKRKRKQILSTEQAIENVLVIYSI